MLHDFRFGVHGLWFMVDALACKSLRERVRAAALLEQSGLIAYDL